MISLSLILNPRRHRNSGLPGRYYSATNTTNDTTTTMSQTPDFWCEICSKDLQSRISLEQHKNGRRHLKRAFRTGKISWTQLTVDDRDQDGGGENEWRRRNLFPNLLPPLSEEELFDNIIAGRYKNIVVLTGAGISTSAGIPDYRSGGGIFDILTAMKDFPTERFPEIQRLPPELIFSRSFANQHPGVWSKHILPAKQALFPSSLSPTLAHKFCAYLYHRGYLKRIYTQNVDGLHSHPSLNIPEKIVVECHGSIHRPNTLVLYGDPVPSNFHDMVNKDFNSNGTSSNGPPSTVDLVIVMGTSLQVAPFCCLPNMVPRGSTRVLVNRRIDHCLKNGFSSSAKSSSFSSAADDCNGGVSAKTMSIGRRKHVKLEPLWIGREGRKRWRQLLVESDCDDFAHRYQIRTGENISSGL